METKKIDIEELEKLCLEAENTFKTLHEQLIQAKKEEEESKQAKLIAEQTARKEEVEAAERHYKKLLSEYTKDYGSYSTTRTYSTNSRNIPEFLKWVFEEV